MADGLDAGSFEFYEGIRIFIPGAITVGLALGVGRTFEVEALDLSDNAIGAIFLALLSGLFFYFIDAPARSAVIRPDQPTERIAEWGLRPKSGTTLNVYLLMLDTVVPAPIRTRALYMGSMFRIGFEAVYLLFLTSLTVLLTPSFSTTRVTWHLDREPLFRPFFVAAAAATLVFVFERERRARAKARQRAERSGRTYQPDPSTVVVYPFEVILVIAMVIGFAALATSDHRPNAWIFAVPACVVAAFWTYRYFKGYKPLNGDGDGGESGPPRPINATHAVLLSATAAVLALATQWLRLKGDHLSGPEELGWSIVLTVALVLIAARGHERRLRGAYYSQNTWLAQNKDTILLEYFNRPEPSPAQDDPEAGPADGATSPADN